MEKSELRRIYADLIIQHEHLSPFGDERYNRSSRERYAACIPDVIAIPHHQRGKIDGNYDVNEFLKVAIIYAEGGNRAISEESLEANVSQDTNFPTFSFIAQSCE